MNKIKKLRKFFRSFMIDGYLVPKNDEYFNEYVSQSNDRLKFISNFSGSAGFAIILKNKNYLFVDGRYTIQARIQSAKNFKIFTIPQKFPKKVLKNKKKLKIGFDPKLHNENQLNFLFNIKNIVLKPISENLVDNIWSKRPKDLIKPFFSLSNKDAGQNSQEKINKVKDMLLKNKADYLFVGDDWFKNKNWKNMEKKLKKIKCKVIYFPYTRGTSSTLINNFLSKQRRS